jgi:hypothetical protein
MKSYPEIEQGTEAWRKIRAGKVTASCMEKIISPTGQESKQADKYMLQILGEIISGEPEETWSGNSDTERGKTLEQEAADYYAMTQEAELEKMGFCTTDDDFLGISPDRFVGDDGLLEIKTAKQSVFVDYLLSGKLEQDHRPQTQCCLYVTGRKWVDTFLYCPTMPKQIIIRSTPNKPFITSMCEYLSKFSKTLADKKSKLAELGYINGI